MFKRFALSNNFNLCCLSHYNCVIVSAHHFPLHRLLFLFLSRSLLVFFSQSLSVPFSLVAPKHFSLLPFIVNESFRRRHKRNAAQKKTHSLYIIFIHKTCKPFCSFSKTCIHTSIFPASLFATI